MDSDRAQGPRCTRVGEQGERGDMAKADAVFIYIGTYPSEAAAQDDYDAAVVTKDDAGRVS